jgi:ABC-2 type transport system permease protein
MKYFTSALWAETLKARRSKVPLISAIGFSLAAVVDGLFMVILKDPEAAKQMGLISTKAQLMAGVADWPTFFNILGQAIAVGGAIVFAVITAWVFGREFSDRTVKEFLALPTSRGTIITAKFIVVAVWTMGLSLLVFGLGLLIGNVVDIPGWSQDLLRASTVDVLGAAVLTILLLPFVALAQVAAIMGWGDWFPWAVPALFSGAAGPRAELLGLHSFMVVGLACALGLASTYLWWQKADQTR